MEYARIEQKNIRASKIASIISGASMIMTLMGLGFLSPILSPIAVIFAFLSKGKTKKMNIASHLAILTSILAVLFFFLECVFMTYNLLYNNEYRRYFRDISNSYSRAMYGESYFDMKDEFDKSLEPYGLSVEICEDKLDSVFKAVGIAPDKRF